MPLTSICPYCRYNCHLSSETSAADTAITCSECGAVFGADARYPEIRTWSLEYGTKILVIRLVATALKAAVSAGNVQKLGISSNLRIRPISCILPVAAGSMLFMVWILLNSTGQAGLHRGLGTQMIAILFAVPSLIGCILFLTRTALSKSSLLHFLRVFVYFLVIPYCTVLLSMLANHLVILDNSRSGFNDWLEALSSTVDEVIYSRLVFVFVLLYSCYWWYRASRTYCN